jgi:ABC-type phosphate/phosphonate transport system substrate-binding protein
MVERSGADGYRSALLCRTGTCETVTDVAGARAAWVDPWSAAGYLMPRAMIASDGLDPDASLREKFVGSYDAAIDALDGRHAEIAGGYCTLAPDGRLLAQSWRADARVRVLALSAPIPSDVLCTTGALSSADSVAVESALARPEARLLARALGGTGLARPDPAHYDPLDRAIRPR